MILKLKRKFMKRIWRESFYIYLWANEWLQRNKERPVLNIDIDDRNSREVDTYIERTSR